MATPFPFVSGSVLTAAQMNAITELPINAKTASHILVAADAGARVQMTSATATTITVNTGLFSAGQSVSIYNNGAGSCTITPGTATVTTNGALTLPTGGGGTLLFTSASAAIWLANSFNIGLQIVKNQTSFSAVTAVTVDSVFTSSYTNYLVLINAVASTGDNMYFKLRAGGVTTSTNYGNQYVNIGGSSISATQTVNQTSALFGTVRATNQAALPLYVFGPQTATWTSTQCLTLDPVGATTFGVANFYCAQTTTTQFDGITFGPQSATTITGTYAIYGYNL